MSKYAYILVFDRDDNLDYVEIHKKITEMPSLYSWFHYIRSSYILISSQQAAHQFIEEVRAAIGMEKQLLLMKVSLEGGDYNGWLPTDAWEWIRERYKELSE
jgi:hypothetical protein